LSATTDPPKPPDDPVLNAVFDLTKAELDTEFKISERYEAKARNYFGIAVAFFGATQAFVLQSNFDSLSSFHRYTLDWFVGVSAVAFGLCLLGAMWGTLQRRDRVITPEQLLGMTTAPDTTLRDVVQQDIALLDARRDANRSRLNRVRISQFTGLIAILATAAEFVAALVYFT
jgi:hypothetical protein